MNRDTYIFLASNDWFFKDVHPVFLYNILYKIKETQSIEMQLGYHFSNERRFQIVYQTHKFESYTWFNVYPTQS